MWRTDLPAAEAAAAKIDSGRPVLTTIKSKLDGSIVGYDAVSSIFTAEVECRILFRQLKIGKCRRTNSNKSTNSSSKNSKG